MAHHPAPHPCLPAPDDPPRPSCPSDRHILEAIFSGPLHRLYPGASFPLHYPSYLTCRRREAEWTRNGVMEAIMRSLLIDLRDRGGLDISKCMKDGSISFDGYQLSVSDQWRGTWQLATALILITPLYKKILARYRRHL